MRLLRFRYPPEFAREYLDHVRTVRELGDVHRRAPLRVLTRHYLRPYPRLHIPLLESAHLVAPGSGRTALPSLLFTAPSSRT